MAVVLDQTTTESAVRASFDGALAELSTLPALERIRVAGAVTSRLTAVRLDAAALVGDADWRTTKEALADDTRPVRDVNRDARRAQAMARNDHLLRAMAAGAIPPETIDHLLRAADKSGAIPVDLIDEVSGLAPDQARRIVAAHIEANTTPDEADDLHRQQMDARRVRRGRTVSDDGVPLGVLSLEGPDSLLNRIYDDLCRAADAAYQGASGRDVPADHHVPWNHRMFDAAVAAFYGDTGEGSVAPGSPRPHVVVTIGLDDLGTTAATQTGSGPISTDTFIDLLGHGDLSTLVLGADGQPLWLGRNRRHASTAQFVALAARDRGCVLCGAGLSQCEAHHRIPWEAPAKGTTDIDNLALLCRSCHRDLHRRGHTLYRRAGSSEAGSRAWLWATRPATEAERPPPRPVRRE